MVGAKRSVKLDVLSAKFLEFAKSKLGKDSKAKDFPFAAPKRPFLVPGSFAELLNFDVRTLTGKEINGAPQPLGEMGVFELALKQIQVICNGIRSDELQEKVCDPAKLKDDVIEVEV